MPVFPISANAVFEPAVTSLMGDAFDQAMRSLRVAPSRIVQEGMASRIIEAASRGERNVDQLRAAALTISRDKDSETHCAAGTVNGVPPQTI
jgi:hypothetical protein